VRPARKDDHPDRFPPTSTQDAEPVALVTDAGALAFRECRIVKYRPAVPRFFNLDAELLRNLGNTGLARPDGLADSIPTGHLAADGFDQGTDIADVVGRWRTVEVRLKQSQSLTKPIRLGTEQT